MVYEIDTRGDTNKYKEKNHILIHSADVTCNTFGNQLVRIMISVPKTDIFELSFIIHNKEREKRERGMEGGERREDTIIPSATIVIPRNFAVNP